MPDTPARHPLRSLTRLMIGGAEIGAEEFVRRLQAWENEVSQAYPPADTAAQNQDESRPVSPHSRLALIGLIFEMQDGLHSGLSRLGRVERLVSGVLSQIFQPVFGRRIMAPSRTRYHRLVARGQAEVQRWVEIGRAEETHSRALAETGFNDVVDTGLEYLASNPELQELVQTQSTGLANEVIEEVRERTVSADTFLEGLARSLLRRVPRATLPEPPVELRTHATSLRPAKKPRTTRQ